MDDDRVIHYALTAFLTREGHEVTSAHDGMEGLEKFKAQAFNLVITDWAMPGIGGDQLALEVKKIAPKVPVIMLTGFADTGAVPSTQSGGIDVLLGKPFTLGGLRRAIAQVTGTSI